MSWIPDYLVLMDAFLSETTQGSQITLKDSLIRADWGLSFAYEKCRS